MNTEEVNSIPEYAESLKGYLQALSTKAAVQERLANQRKNDLPGDIDTVAMAIHRWDDYYSYSDDRAVWRAGSKTEEWLIKHDQWFDRCKSAAKVHLESIGAIPHVDETDALRALRLHAYRRHITDAQWNMIIVPVEVALMTINDYRVGNSYTLPTEVFTGTRTHKVLAVPRYIRDAAERVRTGILAAREQGIDRSTWILLDPDTQKNQVTVCGGRFTLYLTTPHG